MLTILKERSLVLGAVGFDEDALAVLHVIAELSAIALTVLIEILPSSMLLIFEPVSDVQLASDVVVLPFAVLHPISKLALIPLSIIVGEGADPFEFAIGNST